MRYTVKIWNGKEVKVFNCATKHDVHIAIYDYTYSERTKPFIRIKIIKNQLQATKYTTAQKNKYNHNA